MIKIIINDLPKISLNKWYSGQHWTKRKKMKDNYKFIINNQHAGQLLKSNQYDVEYNFHFKSRPLDASNCVAMVKLVEDILFEDDKWDIVKSLRITSNKSDEEYLEIIVMIT